MASARRVAGSEVRPRYLIFGAAGHIGGPCAEALQAVEGPGALRLASSRDEGAEALRDRFPGAQVVRADMTDLASMVQAVRGVDAVFIVTPDFFDDRRGAQILLEACARAGAAPHVVRIQAEIPSVGVEDLPGVLGDPIGRRGHLEARALISASTLPATFLNVFGYYMDDFAIHFGEGLRRDRVLLVPYDRPMTFIDPAELGEAAAAVMRAPPHDAPRLIHLNNGEDGRLFTEVARLIGEAVGAPILYQDDAEAFRAAIGPMLQAMTGRADAADYLLADWRMERAHGALYNGTPDLAALLGRAPRSLRAWLDANAAALRPGAAG
ncbi:MAG: NmrA family NAD(P)-binding protein [Oceanicaulis sp.]